MIKPLGDGRYKLDFYPAGAKGPRIQRIGTKKELKVLQAELELECQAAPGRFMVDRRRLTDLVNLWYRLHGVTLKDAKYRLSRTLAICESLGNPTVDKFDAAVFARYRERRLKEGMSISTVNHETRYLRAVFSELIRLDQFNGKNPLALLRTFSEPETELSFLTAEQIPVLLAECDKSRNTHCGPVVRLCLATGARWSEANDLPISGLFHDRVVYSDTKNGRVRAIPIKPQFSAYLRSAGFPVGKRLFSGCKGAFRKAVERSGIELPEGQLTHVLRHTFASHFLMNGGDILALQRILGHSDLKVTMRYAHLAPDYMAQVPELSPLKFG